MKIAIPTEHNRLHGHFGGCQEFTLVEVDPTTKTTLGSETLPTPEHQPGAFPRWLREKGVEVVIVGGIGQRALAIFAQNGIEVRSGRPGALAEELVTSYLTGTLTSMPDGCTSHGHHHHHGHDNHPHQHHHRHGREDQGEATT